MEHRRDPAIIISAIYHLKEVIDQADAVVSILGSADKLPFPEVGARRLLRLTCDDTIVHSGALSPPRREHIAELIEFAGSWKGNTCLVHCRSGSSRSPAAAMIIARVLGLSGSVALVTRVRLARSYFRPNETMLKLADDLLGTSPGLLELSRSVPVPTRFDKWSPVRISLADQPEPEAG